MQPHLRLTVKHLMFGVAALGLLMSLSAWMTPIAEQVLWIDESGWGGLSGPRIQHLLVSPILSPLVIPALSLVLIWPNRNRRCILAGITATLCVLISWIMLRRIWLITPGGVFLWPDNCLWYLHGRLPNGSKWGGRPTWDNFWPSSKRQIADLSTLVVYLALISVSLRRPLLPSKVAIVPLVANGYSFAGWLTLMWSDRYWGPGNPPLWAGHLGATVPRVSGMEIVQGLVLFSLIGYLLAIIIPIQLGRTFIDGTARLSMRVYRSKGELGT